jgi:hypothetical protein
VIFTVGKKTKKEKARYNQNHICNSFKIILSVAWKKLVSDSPCQILPWWHIVIPSNPLIQMHSSTEDEMYLNVLFSFGVTSHNHLLSPIPLKPSMSKPEHCGVLPMFGLGCQARAHGAPHPCVLTRVFGEVPTLRLEGVAQAHKDTWHALKDWARVLHRIPWVLVCAWAHNHYLDPKHVFNVSSRY